MLSTDERELIVKAHDKGIRVSEIAKNFSVSEVTVYKYINKMDTVGTVAVRTNERGRKSILNDKNLNDIKELILQQPDITIREIKERLNLSASVENIRTHVIQIGFVYKKKSMHASERERSRCSCKTSKMG